MTPDTICQIIRQSLQPLTASRHPLYSPNTETIMLMAAAHESHLGKYLRQIGGGPARGIWQVEIATMEDNYLTFIVHRSALAQQIIDITGIDGPDEDALEHNHRYDCIHARLKLYRRPGAIPDDLDGMAEYLVKEYNAGGDATAQEYLGDYRRLVG